tara:strand:- start:5195 stop:5836 length:642 start_codon:yes stop_codon:yes gene_type:complete
VSTVDREQIADMATDAPPQSRRLEVAHGLRGLTLKGGFLNKLILDGHKVVENRSWIIPPGWYALHTGKGSMKVGEFERLQSLFNAECAERNLHPSMENYTKCRNTGICGVVHISHALPLDKMNGNRWASGPFCHVISDAAFLNEPIPCLGALGLWKLTGKQIDNLNDQLSTMEFRSTGHEQAFPPDDAALAAAKKRQREERAEHREKKRAREM